MFFHVCMFYWLFVWLCFFQWHFIDLFSCIAVSLFNILTYLLTGAQAISSVDPRRSGINPPEQNGQGSGEQKSPSRVQGESWTIGAISVQIPSGNLTIFCSKINEVRQITRMLQASGQIPRMSESANPNWLWHKHFQLKPAYTQVQFGNWVCLMLPILIRSVLKYISIIGIYYPIRQAVPVVDSPITKVKFTQIVLISLTNDIFPPELCPILWQCKCLCSA